MPGAKTTSLEGTDLLKLELTRQSFIAFMSICLLVNPDCIRNYSRIQYDWHRKGLQEIWCRFRSKIVNTVRDFQKQLLNMQELCCAYNWKKNVRVSHLQNFHNKSFVNFSFSQSHENETPWKTNSRAEYLYIVSSTLVDLFLVFYYFCWGWWPLYRLGQSHRFEWSGHLIQKTWPTHPYPPWCLKSFILL